MERRTNCVWIIDIFVMKHFFLEALGPFVTSFGLLAISFCLVSVLRGRDNRLDHRGVGSRFASALGTIGIGSIVLVSLVFVWRQLAAGYEASHAPTMTGGIVGVLLSSLGFARYAFRRS